MATIAQTGVLRARLPAIAALVAGGFVATAALLPVLLVHGLLPGQINDGPANYITEGAMQCLHDLGLNGLTSWCHEYGEPRGFPFLTGGPLIGLGALFMYLPGVGSYPAYLLAGATVDAVALAGGFGLLRRLGAPRWAALGGAVAYLLTPTVVGLTPFGGTFFGFALLPAYAFADLLAIERIERYRDWRTLAATAGAYAALRTMALFMDGYSFVASVLIAVMLWLAWLLSARPPRRRALAGVALVVLANAVAFVVYRLYVPGAYETNPIGIFRAMGLDLVTFVEPTGSFWIADALGLTTDHANLWGDGTNSRFNYVGFAALALAVGYVVRRPRRREAVALGAAGLVALVLALGPSLKVAEVRAATGARIAEADYLMPANLAIDLPWADLFTEVPGVNSMRATYRWFGVGRLALIVLATLAVARLARRRGRRVLAAALAGVAMIELAPNVPWLVDRYQILRADAVALRTDVRGDLQAATRDGERVFFLSDDRTHNDFLVNYLAPAADIRAYNTGGDKNLIIAQQHWPAEVAALAAAPTPEAVAQALASGTLDVVIAPFFHLRWSAYSWPPTAAERAAAEAAFAPLLADRRFTVERHEWFATVRLRRDGG